MVQTGVGKADTAEALYAFVEGVVEHGGEPFVLKYLGPPGAGGGGGRQVGIPRDGSRLIRDLRFSAAELVTFVWGEGASAEARLGGRTLRGEWVGRAEKLEVKEVSVGEEKSEPGPVEKGKKEGKKKEGPSGADKENRLRNILGKGLFKR